MTTIMWNIDSSDWRYVAAGEGPGGSLGTIKSEIYGLHEGITTVSHI